VEIKKMIQILDTAHNNFEQEKQAFISEIKQQEEVIRELRENNEALNEYHAQTEEKIEEMVRIYTEESDKLKQELKELREESMMS
jgi:predicted  nucleic acid-binding Zn-ribbon protein